MLTNPTNELLLKQKISNILKEIKKNKLASLRRSLRLHQEEQEDVVLKITKEMIQDGLKRYNCSVIRNYNDILAINEFIQ